MKNNQTKNKVAIFALFALLAAGSQWSFTNQPLKEGTLSLSSTAGEQDIDGVKVKVKGEMKDTKTGGILEGTKESKFFNIEFEGKFCAECANNYSDTISYDASEYKDFKDIEAFMKANGQMIIKDIKAKRDSHLSKLAEQKRKEREEKCDVEDDKKVECIKKRLAEETDSKKKKELTKMAKNLIKDRFDGEDASPSEARDILNDLLEDVKNSDPFSKAVTGIYKAKMFEFTNDRTMSKLYSQYERWNNYARQPGLPFNTVVWAERNAAFAKIQAENEIRKINPENTLGGLLETQNGRYVGGISREELNSIENKFDSIRDQFGIAHEINGDHNSIIGGSRKNQDWRGPSLGLPTMIPAFGSRISVGNGNNGVTGQPQNNFQQPGTGFQQQPGFQQQIGVQQNQTQGWSQLPPPSNLDGRNVR